MRTADPAATIADVPARASIPRHVRVRFSLPRQSMRRSYKYYVDGIQRPVARGWLHTIFLWFAYPIIAYHLLLRPEYQDRFLAPQW